MMTEKEIQKAKDEMFPYQENVGRSYEQALAASGFELGARWASALNEPNISFKEQMIRSCIEIALTDVSEKRFSDYGTSLKECLEWIEEQQNKIDSYEKQGEFDENIITREDEILQAISVGLTDIEEVAGWSDFGGIPIEEIQHWLEKQGEKPQGKSVLEAINEEKVDNRNCVKPTDKVELKFKVGDYIVNDYCAGRVVALTDDAYLLDTEQGIPFSCEHNVHLWTIQDAKDGDVLISQSGNPLIYNGNYNSFNIGAYCGMTCDDNKFKVAE